MSEKRYVSAIRIEHLINEHIGIAMQLRRCADKSQERLGEFAANRMRGEAEIHLSFCRQLRQILSHQKKNLEPKAA